MITHNDLDKIREESEAENTWRKYSRHVIADLLEGCAMCGAIREKEHLTHCRWCEDAYFCKNDVCSQQHNAEMHPAVAFWTW